VNGLGAVALGPCAHCGVRPRPLRHGRYIGHNGDIPGYEAAMTYDPHTGTLIVEPQNARLGEKDQAFNPPELDLQLPSASVPTNAGILA
jgi:hypothetical protein